MSLSGAGWVLLFALAGVLLYAIVLYNRLVGDRVRVRSAWSDVDVQLKRRGDLIPKLVDTVRQYAGYERATLEAVVELRTQAANSTRVADRALREQALAGGMRQLLALVESYPALKADQVFLELQQSITEVEEHIQFARRYYNGAVRALNTRVETFPDLLLARVLAFHSEDYFELDDERSVVSGR